MAKVCEWSSSREVSEAGVRLFIDCSPSKPIELPVDLVNIKRGHLLCRSLFLQGDRIVLALVAFLKLFDELLVPLDIALHVGVFQFEHVHFSFLLFFLLLCGA